MKVADNPPCGIVMVGGTAAMVGLLLVSDTELPPPGAGPLSLTVAVELSPPFTLAGDIDREDTAGGVTVSVADFIVPLLFAVMVTAVEFDVGKVAMGKLAAVAPAGTVTLGGTEATELSLEESATITPPE